jgi:tRNA (cytidine/uridine-2'-O-)-methyltransferase
MLDILLYEPEIPPNTGNVIRLAANTGFRLHLIEPLGFSPDDAKLRRAGLDYHEWARVARHASLEAALASLSPAHVYAFSTNGSSPFTTVAYQPGDALLFGPESRGLPAAVMAQASAVLRVPMQPGSRSLNLANTVAVVVYEAWRQLGFDGGQ